MPVSRRDWPIVFFEHAAQRVVEPPGPAEFVVGLTIADKDVESKVLGGSTIAGSISVAFRSAKERGFRGAKGDYVIRRSCGELEKAA